MLGLGNSLTNQYFPSAVAFSNTASLAFDGTNDYLDCGDLSELASATTLTVMGWYKQTTLDQIRALFSVGASLNESVAIYTYSDGKMYMDMRSVTASTSGFGSFDYSTVVTAGEWFHVAMVFTGGGADNAAKLKCYIDGSAVTLAFSGTVPTVTSAVGTDCEIGESQPHAINNIPTFLGGVDEVAIFDEALASSKINTIYNSGVPTDLSGESGLVGYWRMEEGTGTSVADSSDNSYTGTLTNGATWSEDVPS
tara:strand:- start:321 stop:1076 length:756 start_codon:yes stop_codon:yes gene_type:complete